MPGLCIIANLIIRNNLPEVDIIVFILPVKEIEFWEK